MCLRNADGGGGGEQEGERGHWVGVWKGEGRERGKAAELEPPRTCLPLNHAAA